jgi:hypothetical protein
MMVEMQSGSHMFTDAMVEEMADDVHLRGTTHICDNDGNRLIVCTATRLGIAGTKEFALIYENKGALFFTLERPLNQFRLMTAGFSMLVAGSIADMVNKLIAAVAKRIEAGRPALPGTTPMEAEGTPE